MRENIEGMLEWVQSLSDTEIVLIVLGNAIIVGVIRCNHFRNRDLYLLPLVDEYEKRVFALA